MKNQMTLQIVVTWPGFRQELLPWTGFACATPGLCVVPKPKLDHALRREQKSVWKPEPDNWQIMHTGSGLPLRVYYLEDKAAALKLADDLGDLCDWTQSAEDICNVSADVTRARSAWIDRLYIQAGAEGVPDPQPC